MKRIGVGGIVSGKGLPKVEKVQPTDRELLQGMPWEARPHAEKIVKRLEVLQQDANEKRHHVEALERFSEWEERTTVALRHLHKVFSKANEERTAALETVMEELQTSAHLIVDGYIEAPKDYGGERNRALIALGKYRRGLGKGMSSDEIGIAQMAYETIESSLEATGAFQDLLSLKKSLQIDDLSDEMLESLFLHRIIVGITDETAKIADVSMQVKDALDQTGLSNEQKVEALVIAKRKLDAQQNGKVDLGVAEDLYLDDRRVMALAVSLWESSYKVSHDIDDVFAAVRKMLNLRSALEEKAPTEDELFSIYAAGMFLASWAHVAFPRIMTSHTYAAALMCTSVTDDILSDLVIQWPAFEINVPDGILMHEGRDYNRIRINVDERTACFWLYTKKHDRKLPFAPYGIQKTSLADILVEPCGPTEIDRVVFMARRLTSGLLLAMQHTDNFKERTVIGTRSIGEKRKPPDHRVVFVGAPIKIDARPAVVKFLASNIRRGKPAPPSVQMLVRGHHKRQVMGVGRMGRKVIWIQPYWKGPEDAPILSRPKKLGGPKTS